MQRICMSLLLGLVGFRLAALAQEFVPPPKAERDYVAAIAKLGGRAEVDEPYLAFAVNERPFGNSEMVRAGGSLAGNDSSDASCTTSRVPEASGIACAAR